MTFLYLALDPEPAEGQAGAPYGVTLMGEIDGRQRYLSPKELPETSFELVGRWERDGTLISFDAELFATYFKTFGNDEDGYATDSLNVHYYQGHKQRHMQGDSPGGSPEYPADNQPFSIVMEHDEITEGAWQGHGWKATMMTEDPNRDILVRAIGIYSDPECTNYLYTTGAFIMTDTGEVDEDDQAILRPQTICPLGQLNAEKEDIYFALLLGAAQEGIMNLPTEIESIEKNFWVE